jgi:pyruvate dehydrogenase E1 component alpha subunit
MSGGDDGDGVMESRMAIRTDDLEAYRRMVEIRVLEDRIQDLFREGLVDGTTHTCQGQEAVAVGVAAALEPTDTVACTYRGHGHALALGLSAEKILAEILGRIGGCMNGLGGSMHLSSRPAGLLPSFAIVGAGLPIAAGAGLAAKVLGTRNVGVGICGDGATNIGAFHEALNLAAIWKLPVVFVIENNHYGEYSRIDKTTPIVDLARRADGYGIPGIIVDGQDFRAVRKAMSLAVEAARRGDGPTLIEAKTYRYAGHSRSDQALYRPPGELAEWQKRDPIEILGDQLIAEGTATPDTLSALRQQVEDAVAGTTETVLQMETPDATMMLRNVFAGAK